MSTQELHILANALLHKAGYRYDGSYRGSVSKYQGKFEKRVMIKIPMGGQPKK